MSVQSVRAYLERYGAGDKILEFDQPSATVGQAAEDVGVEPARIAKTMAFLVPGDDGSEGDDGREKTRAILIVCAGDAKVWNAPYKARFHTKPRMVSADDLERLVGHPMGGVCPFDRRPGVACYLDESLRRFERVWPAAGSENSAIGCTLAELEEWGQADGWVDVCKGWRDGE